MARGFPAVINFLTLALFTRLLTQEEYGQYALVVAGVALAYALPVQWLSHAVLRLSVPYSAERPAFLATVARLLIPILCSAAILLGLGIGSAAKWRNTPLIAAGVGLFLAQSWHELNLSLATADRRPKRYGMLSTIKASASLLLGGTAAWAGLGVVGVLIGVALGGAISGAYGYACAWAASRGVPADSGLRRELVRYGLPLAGVFLLSYVISSSDRFFLAQMISPAAAGAYAPAYDLVLQAMVAIMMVVNLVTFPLAVVAVDSGDLPAREQHFRKHATILCAVAVPAAAGIAVLAPSLSRILGPQFAGSALVLIPLFAFAQLLSGVKSYYFDLSFQLSRATAYQLASVAVGAIVNVAFNLWLIPIYGTVGAAYATIAAYLAALIVSWGLGRRLLPLPIPWAAVMRVGAATAGMCMALLAIRRAGGGFVVLGQVSLGVTVYCLLMLVLARGRWRGVLAP